ncbi:rhomboid-like protein [Streptomyces sp. NPDC060235]|uniref:rhomboid-like protein n=1 Tax=unclassified Streptomyces TaxID=2593676 RepID=UPI003662A1A9
MNRNSDGRHPADGTSAERGAARAERSLTGAPSGPGGTVPGLLGGLPRQRSVPTTTTTGPGPAPSPAVSGRAVEAARLPVAVRSVLRLLPTPLGTPFTFGYALVLAVTSYVASHADPAIVRSLHQASSTDVAHLVRYPVAVLFASALWIVGGFLSPYAAGFLLVLTALERRIGGARAAGVFLLGHVVATLATEVPVGLAVWAGHLPGSSLHRFDYGISFGVAASVGALAGLLSPWLRWPLLTLIGSVLAENLILLDDPMTNWGHLLALALGVATWPLVRRAARARAAASGAVRT